MGPVIGQWLFTGLVAEMALSGKEDDELVWSDVMVCISLGDVQGAFPYNDEYMGIQLSVRMDKVEVICQISAG